MDTRVAQAIETIRDVEVKKAEEGAGRQAFRRLADADRKQLYKQYGFEESERELPKDLENK